MYLAQTIEAIKNAKKPLFQLSSGKDSICALLKIMHAGCLYFDIAWVSTGDNASETFETMKLVKQAFNDRFHEIKSDSFTVREKYGIPSPIIQAHHIDEHLTACRENRVIVQSQYMCCLRTYMIPLQEFTLDGGYDLVIRGTRSSDRMKTPLKHLENDGFYTVAYPIYDMTDDEVTAYLSERGCLPSFYQHTTSGIDCVSCPAYWGNGHQRWLEATDPAKAEIRRQQINELLIYITESAQTGMKELGLLEDNNYGF